MNAAELAMPAITVHRGLITRGKPHPEEYLLAVELLGVQPQDPVG
jgi:beta-phosphoglucomutase-like phosphatase (HAD superfamily)